MSYYDATQSNESKRSAKIYRDLDLDFQFNSATKELMINAPPNDEFPKMVLNVTCKVILQL